MENVKKFIKLHDDETNAPLIINTDVINDIFYNVDEKCSVITFTNNNNEVLVKENVDRIYSMIYESEK